nr:olfactory receptor 5AR1-like [Anolis sagrei ordinatus]
MDKVTEFILLRFTDDPNLQVVLFLPFLTIYITTVIGSLGLIVLIQIESHLHTPMYFFLGHLSLTDLCYTSAIAPKMLLNLLVENKTISYSFCAAQLCLFAGFVSTECFLLAVMAFDRYVAICNPLHYSAVMSHKVCSCLTASSYAAGFANSTIQTVCIFQLSYCRHRHNIIRHFFCDILELLKLSCSETYLSESLSVYASGTVAMASVSTIIASYFSILSAILKIHSAKGRHKALSTCASHLTSVALLYGTGIFIYLHPNLKYQLDTNIVIFVFYTLVVPMLNPFIYSLRNKEVKKAIRKVVTRKKNNSLSKGFEGNPHR